MLVFRIAPKLVFFVSHVTDNSAACVSLPCYEPNYPVSDNREHHQRVGIALVDIARLEQLSTRQLNDSFELLHTAQNNIYE